MQGKIDSWAIRWCYTQSKQMKLTMYPTKGVVFSRGTDGRGTHCDPTSVRFSQTLAVDFKYKFENNLSVDRKVMKRYRKVVNRSIWRKLGNIAKNAFENVNK